MAGLDQLVFASSNADVLKELTEQRSINIYKKKQVIYAEGNHPLQLFYVLKEK
jgi:hypothetical protein